MSGAGLYTKVRGLDAQEVQNVSLVDALNEVAATEQEKRLQALPELADGKTVPELALEAGKGEDWVRTRLSALIDKGQVQIGRKKSQDLSGRSIWKQVYKLLVVLAVILGGSGPFVALAGYLDCGSQETREMYDCNKDARS